MLRNCDDHVTIREYSLPGNPSVANQLLRMEGCEFPALVCLRDNPLASRRTAL